MKANDDVRKVIMAGIGALSAAAEKTQETIDSLAEKGEEALNHSRVINERLRHKIKQVLDDDKPEQSAQVKDILDTLDQLTPEERQAIRAKLSGMDAGE